MFTEEAAPLRPRNKHRDCLTMKLGKENRESTLPIITKLANTKKKK